MTIEELEAIELASYDPSLYTSTDEFLVIDSDSRTITIPSIEGILGVANDRDSEVKYFICPRVVGTGFSLNPADYVDLETDLILRINYINASNETATYIINNSDVVVDDDTIKFGWKLDSNVMKKAGNVQFIFCARIVKPSEDMQSSTVIEEWNTTIATGRILSGIETDDSWVEPIDDLIETIAAKVYTKVYNDLVAHLATVALTGSYNDLTDRPNILDVNETSENTNFYYTEQGE